MERFGDALFSLRNIKAFSLNISIIWKKEDTSYIDSLYKSWLRPTNLIFCFTSRKVRKSDSVGVYLTLGVCAARVTVVSLTVCVCVCTVSVCLSVTTLTATYLVCKTKVRYHRVLYGVLQTCNVWISLKMLRSKVMALFAYHRCLPHSLKSSRWTEETAVSSF